MENEKTDVEETLEEIEETLNDVEEKEPETNDKDVDVASEQSDADIAKAAIESDTAIKLAEIQADLERMRIKVEEKREKEWTETAKALEAKISALTEKMEAMQLTRETLTDQVTEIVENTEQAETNNSTPQFMSPPISETKTEATLENEDGEKVKAVVKINRKRRMI